MNIKNITIKVLYLFLFILLLSNSELNASTYGIDTGSINKVLPTATLGSNAERHFDVKFHQAPLKDALQFLCWIGEVNVIIPEDVVGTTTVSFRDIAIRNAITSIVKVNGLEYTVEGDVVRVGSKDAFHESGEDLQTETFRLRYAVASDMKTKIEKLLSSRGSILEDERTNSIVVRELPSNLGNIKRMIQDVDIRDAQVLIEAKILEATRSFSRDLGIQWGANMQGNTVNMVGLDAVGASDSDNPLNVNLGAGTPTSGIGLLIGQLAGGTSLDLQISAAERRGDVYIISDPSIVTSNGQPAHIRSGSTLLIQTTGDINIGAEGGSSTSGGSGSGLQEIKTGVELNVTPYISVEDFLKLNIEAITSQPDFTRSIQGIPVVVDNKATTTVLVKDGETTVIGGLSRYSDTKTKNRVPFFSRIPILGNLFKSKNRQRDNSELMIFIKPTVVRGNVRLPAQTQARIKEIENRYNNMKVNPIIKVDEKNKGEVKSKQEMKKSKNKNSGNKYVRERSN